VRHLVRAQRTHELRTTNAGQRGSHHDDVRRRKQSTPQSIIGVPCADDREPHLL
jgi:hypothetical protein